MTFLDVYFSKQVESITKLQNNAGSTGLIISIPPKRRASGLKMKISCFWRLFDLREENGQ
jgi:hypothetical protein